MSADRALPLRYRAVWLGIGVVALVVGLGLALAPLAAPPRILGGDKGVHFLSMMLLTIWFLGICDTRMTAWVAILLAGYGIGVEILQGFTPYRAADPYDVLADLGGVATGVLASVVGLRHWCRRLESLLGVGTS
jgi:VanZ family protein